jgi:O-antigen ligase
MRSSLLFFVFVPVALLAGFLIPQYPASILLWGLLALAIFILSFINIEWGLYILIFSMLLSPEITIGHTSKASLDRGVTLRFEDFLLIVISLSWFAKNVIYKELGLFRKTPLNKAILFYVLACIIATCLGIIEGRAEVKTGSLFVLKYIEYFIVFFMVINHVKDEEQVKRFIFCLFLTCFITAIIGILQIPGGDRVSAPFEGETSEPNTFGGYLLFIGCIAAGILSKTQNHKIKKLLIFFIIVMILPFLFTQSRSSYLALIPACMTIGFMVKRRIIILGLIIISISLSPLFLPAPVKNRILYTFTQPEGSGQVTIGDIRLDTSTSARLVSWREALKDWFKQPILGYGVTGYTFVDAQYPRVLTETGILGFIAFMYLLFSIFKLAVNTLRNVTTPHFKGLCIGFMAGYIGLLVHALAANTFIIVRIMEPFWFFVGIVAVLPALERQKVNQVQTDEVPRRKLVEVS